MLISAKVFAVFSAALLLCMLCRLAFDARSTVDKVNANLDELHATLVVTHKVASDARLTIDNLNKAALDERFYFEAQVPAALKQVQGILTDTDQLLLTANQTTAALTVNQNRITDQTVAVMTAATETVSLVGDTAHQATANLTQLQTEQQSLDKLLADPDIPDTLHHIDSATGSIADASADVKDEVHRITHPKPLANVINWTLKISSAVAQWFRAIP